MFVDSHAHLEFPEFDADRDQLFERARASGVEYILAMGGASGPDHLDSGLRIAEERANVWATAGIHPHDARAAAPRHFDYLATLSKLPKIVAVGEIGLDYHYDNSPRDVQRRVLVAQMEIAAAARRPIVIHCREAWDDCLRLLEEHWRAHALGGILHCFSGTWDDACRGIEMGFCVSFAGNVTFPKAQSLREVAVQVPLDHLLTETDCPFLTPVPHRGKRNEPAFVRHTAEHIARLRGIPAEELGAATTANLLRFVRAETQ